jgi:hypothetical protein
MIKKHAAHIKKRKAFDIVPANRNRYFPMLLVVGSAINALVHFLGLAIVNEHHRAVVREHRVAARDWASHQHIIKKYRTAHEPWVESINIYVFNNTTTVQKSQHTIIVRIQQAVEPFSSP